MKKYKFQNQSPKNSHACVPLTTPEFYLHHNYSFHSEDTIVSPFSQKFLVLLRAVGGARIAGGRGRGCAPLHGLRTSCAPRGCRAQRGRDNGQFHLSAVRLCQGKDIQGMSQEELCLGGSV